jgi:hypothetical protein
MTATKSTTTTSKPARKRSKPLPRVALPAPICCGTAKGTYRTGDGDTLPSLRPGSTDAFKLRSHGIRA